MNTSIMPEHAPEAFTTRHVPLQHLRATGLRWLAAGVAGLVLLGVLLLGSGCAATGGDPATTFDECRLARLAAIVLAAHPDATPAQVAAANAAADLACGQAPPAVRGPGLLGVGPLIPAGGRVADGRLEVDGIRVFSSTATVPAGTRLVSPTPILALGDAWERTGERSARLRADTGGARTELNVGRVVVVYQSGVVPGTGYVIGWNGRRGAAFLAP